MNTFEITAIARPAKRENVWNSYFQNEPAEVLRIFFFFWNLDHFLFFDKFFLIRSEWNRKIIFSPFDILENSLYMCHKYGCILNLITFISSQSEKKPTNNIERITFFLYRAKSEFESTFNHAAHTFLVLSEHVKKNHFISGRLGSCKNG